MAKPRGFLGMPMIGKGVEDRGYTRFQSRQKNTGLKTPVGTNRGSGNPGVCVEEQQFARAAPLPVWSQTSVIIGLS
jgi:hypothetical protein